MIHTRQENLFEPVIEAAGGLVWKNTLEGERLVIIHRPKYNDWVLPKGKRDPGESWQETALREITEETACATQLTAFAGSVSYEVSGVAKVVLFWEMRLIEEYEFHPNDEVDRREWLTLEQALSRLSYETERNFLSGIHLGSPT